MCSFIPKFASLVTVKLKFAGGKKELVVIWANLLIVALEQVHLNYSTFSSTLVKDQG